jgi:hypothetical protein
VTDNTTDFFDNAGGGSGAPTAVLKNVNDMVSGEIVEMFKRDYVPFGKTDPEKDESEDDGKRKQLVIILQTQLRNWQGVTRVPKVDHNDPNSPEKAPSEDDGKRAVYVPNRSNLQYAIGKAVSAAGPGTKFSVGGTLGVRIFNLKDTGKGNPLKEHEARYQAPTAGSEFFGQAAAPAAAAPAPAAQPAAPATPPPAAPAPAAQPAAAQDPWATQPAAAPVAAPAPEQAAPAPAGDPWATPAAATTPGDPWATAAPATSQPPF